MAQADMLPQVSPSAATRLWLLVRAFVSVRSALHVQKRSAIEEMCYSCIVNYVEGVKKLRMRGKPA